MLIQCVGLETLINLMPVLVQYESHDRGCKSFGETIFLWLLLGSKNTHNIFHKFIINSQDFFHLNWI